MTILLSNVLLFTTVAPHSDRLMHQMRGVEFQQKFAFRSCWYGTPNGWQHDMIMYFKGSI